MSSTFLTILVWNLLLLKFCSWCKEEQPLNDYKQQWRSMSLSAQHQIQLLLDGRERFQSLFWICFFMTVRVWPISSTWNDFSSSSSFSAVFWSKIFPLSQENNVRSGTEHTGVDIKYIRQSSDTLKSGRITYFSEEFNTNQFISRNKQVSLLLFVHWFESKK